MAAVSANLVRNGFRILHVEDDFGDAEIMKALLRETGLEDVELTHVDRLHDALRHLRHNTVDLILLDVEMPDAVAVKFDVVAIRRCSRAPIILVTGLDRKSVKAALDRHPSLGYQNKAELSAGVLRQWIMAQQQPKADPPAGDPGSPVAVNSILQSMSDAVLVLDSRGNTHWANDAGWALLEHSWDEQLSRSLDRGGALPSSIVVAIANAKNRSVTRYEARLDVLRGEDTDALTVAVLRPLRD